MGALHPACSTHSHWFKALAAASMGALHPLIGLKRKTADPLWNLDVKSLVEFLYPQPPEEEEEEKEKEEEEGGGQEQEETLDKL